MVADKKTGFKFLVDTRANVSLFPQIRIRKHMPKTDLELYAANSAPINTYDKRPHALNLSLCREFSWEFIVRDVEQLILSLHFLKHCSLLLEIQIR